MQFVKEYEVMKKINFLLKLIGLENIYHVGENEFEDGIFYVRDGWLYFSDEKTFYKETDIVDVRYRLYNIPEDDQCVLDDPDYVRIIFNDGEEFYFSKGYDFWSIHMKVPKIVDGEWWPGFIEEDAVKRHLITGKTKFEFNIDLDGETFARIRDGKRDKLLLGGNIYGNDIINMSCKELKTKCVARVIGRPRLKNLADFEEMTEAEKVRTYDTKDSNLAFMQYIESLGFKSEREMKSFIRANYNEGERGDVHVLVLHILN
jgi:hypothetical protein